MRIAVNCRSILLNQRTGIGRYTYHLLDSLGQIDHANQYILHTPKGLFDFKRSLPDFSDYKNLKRYPDYFRQGAGGADVYHLPCPDDTTSCEGRLVVTIHDLVHKTYPQAHTSQTIELTEKYMTQIAAGARKIICISENTRRDLHAFYDIPKDKTCVIYSGVDGHVFHPLSLQERKTCQAYLAQLGIFQPYVMFVGTLEPRKNLEGLLEAFSILHARKIFHGQLVVVGMQGWMVEKLDEKIEKLGLKGEVIFTGFVNDAQLAGLYNLARLFVFPSFYEGFGFPILEAFACGVPVAASATSSCAEIAGQAALTFDPDKSSEIAEAMALVLTNEALGASLREAGLKRAGEFTFLETARKTLAVYEGLLRA